MRLIIAAISLVGLIGPAICQTPTPPVQASIGEKIRIDSFESHKRGDNYAVASFVISNTTDRALKSIELTCWVGDDREHGTKVLVWPSTPTIPAHEQQKFSNVNIGVVGANARSECEVTGAE
jgi:hypothetical protein